MVKPYKYKGILAKHYSLKLPLADWLRGPEKEPSADGIKAVQQQLGALDDALFLDCGVDRKAADGWMQVALKLAARHVPAFQLDTSKKMGAPRRNHDDGELTLEIAALLGKGKTIKNAARIVATRRRKGESPEAIEQRYHRTMKDWKRADDIVKGWVRAAQQK